MSNDYPKEPCATYHVHDDESWQWDAVCEVCVVVRPAAGAMPGFNIAHLHRQNVLGVTTAEEVKDVLSNVKPEDREKIGRV